MISEKVSTMIASMCIRGLSQKHGLSKTSKERLTNAVSYSLSRTEFPYNESLQKPTSFYLAGLKAKPFWETNEVDTAKILESSYLMIKKELLNLRKNDNLFLNAPEYTSSGHWAVYEFFAYGKKIEENCNRCPETASCK